MGKRGPTPVPTKILELRGSWRAKLNKNEPKPEQGKPICPSWLSPEAKRIWREAVRILSAMGVLTKADRFVLIRYCDAFARWMSAAEYLSKYGDVYAVKDKDGKVKSAEEWPQSRIYMRLSVLLTKIEDRLGLSPAARTRIMVAADPDSGMKDEPNRWSGLAGA